MAFDACNLLLPFVFNPCHLLFSDPKRINYSLPYWMYMHVDAYITLNAGADFLYVSCLCNQPASSSSKRRRCTLLYPSTAVWHSFYYHHGSQGTYSDAGIIDIWRGRYWKFFSFPSLNAYTTMNDPIPSDPQMNDQQVNTVEECTNAVNQEGEQQEQQQQQAYMVYSHNVKDESCRLVATTGSHYNTTVHIILATEASILQHPLKETRPYNDNDYFKNVKWYVRHSQL